MDEYMSKIHSRLSLQAVENHSKNCAQTRSIRKLILTQVHKDKPLLGYSLTGDRSIFVKEEGRYIMKIYKCAQKVPQLWIPSEPTCYDKRPII